MRAALGFLTALPIGGPAPDRRTLVWFPLAGAALGAALGGVWWAAGEVFPPLVAAAVVVAADLVVTGALHVDGLADTADGVLPHLDGPDRRRAVMAAPDVGAFGVAAVVAVVLLRWSALATIEPDTALLASLWAASRAAMALALVAIPYVGGGLGAAFLGARRPSLAVVAVAVPITLAALAREPVAAVAALVAGSVAAAGVVALARARLGGTTGDVAGAAGLVAETAGLVVAAARW
jgi:adenosylcobinamide-GDP ribazoletransferase